MDPVDRKVTELPVADDREHPEAERTRAGGEAVESVGEIDRVRGGHDDEDREEEPTRSREVPTRVGVPRE